MFPIQTLIITPLRNVMLTVTRELGLPVINERKVRLTTHALCPELILAVFINALQKRQAALPSPTRPFSGGSSSSNGGDGSPALETKNSTQLRKKGTRTYLVLRQSDRGLNCVCISRKRFRFHPPPPHPLRLYTLNSYRTSRDASVRDRNQ